MVACHAIDITLLILISWSHFVSCKMTIAIEEDSVNYRIYDCDCREDNATCLSGSAQHADTGSPNLNLRSYNCECLDSLNCTTNNLEHASSNIIPSSDESITIKFYECNYIQEEPNYLTDYSQSSSSDSTIYVVSRNVISNENICNFSENFQCFALQPANCLICIYLDPWVDPCNHSQSARSARAANYNSTQSQNSTSTQNKTDTIATNNTSTRSEISTNAPDDTSTETSTEPKDTTTYNYTTEPTNSTEYDSNYTTTEPTHSTVNESNDNTTEPTNSTVYDSNDNTTEPTNSTLYDGNNTTAYPTNSTEEKTTEQVTSVKTITTKPATATQSKESDTTAMIVVSAIVGAFVVMAIVVCAFMILQRRQMSINYNRQKKLSTKTPANVTEQNHLENTELKTVI